MTATLIVAGGTIKAKHRESWKGLLPEGTWNRALADLNGRPMLDYVVDAVRPATDGRLLVAGDVPLPDGAVAVAGGGSLVTTLLNGVAALAPDETRLMVVTADIPFLTPEALRDLLDNGPDAEFVYSIIEAERCRQRFPEMRRTTLAIAEGVFTGGNVVLLDPQFVRRNEAAIRHAYELRKNVMGLAALLGAGTIARVLASRLNPKLLPLAYLEAAVSRLVGGARVAAYVSPFAEVGADVDRPEDIALARRYLAGV